MKQKILSLIIILMVGTQPLFPFEWEEDTLTKEVNFSNKWTMLNKKVRLGASMLPWKPLTVWSNVRIVLTIYIVSWLEKMTMYMVHLTFLMKNTKLR